MAKPGPRNIDTGLKWLDVLFRGQLLALTMAILAAVVGFVAGGSSWRERVIGLLSLGLTVLIVGAIVGFATFGTDQLPQPANNQRPTAPADVESGSSQTATLAVR